MRLGLWAVFPKEDEGFAGFVALMHPGWLPSDAHRVEVGWRLARSGWGRGYATEAGRAALAVGFGQLGLPEVVSLIHPDNRRSIAVAERLGLTLERTATHPTDGQPISVYRLGREEWSGAIHPSPRPGRRGQSSQT